MNTGYDQYGTRRRSISGGFPAGGGFPPPHSDGGGYRRDGFNNDPYNNSSSYNNSSYQEVSGPPTYPPGMSQGRLPTSNMSYPDDEFSVPPPLSQSYASGGPGSFPSSAGMPASYPMGGTRELYSSSPYGTGMNSTGLSPLGTAAYSNSYDNSPLSDNHYPLDDGFAPRGRTLSTGGGFGSQALIAAPPMGSYPSHYSAKRSRRASSVGPGGMGYAGIVGDPFRRHPSGHTTIKFRLKGSAHSGISVNEAIERARLSQGTAYLLHDISMDMSGKMDLKVRVRFISSIVFVVPFDSCDFVLRDQWSGYRSNMYNIPLSTDYHGYVDVQSLARRTARAIAHFMEVNALLQLVVLQHWAHSLFADKRHRPFL